MGFTDRSLVRRLLEMRKTTKIVAAAFVLLIVAVIPVYFIMRQNIGNEENIQIRGAVANSTKFTYNQLKTLSPVTIAVTLSSTSHLEDNGIFNYSGITLKTLLEQAQIPANATSVYVQAADGYGTTISIQDAQKDNTIIAYEKDGAALTPLSSGGEGPFRLVIGDDQYAQRWIRGVSVIEVS